MSSKKPRRKKAQGPKTFGRAESGLPPAALPAKVERRLPPLAYGLAALLVVAAVIGWFALRSKTKTSEPSPAQSGVAPKLAQAVHAGPVTFNRDIAPIIFDRCSGCHHEGQAAPFPLLSYADVRKRSKTILAVIERHYMPPWLPEKGYGDFMGERRLSDAENKLIEQWINEGVVEGDASDLPPTPRFNEGWQLGQPDLTVTLAAPYRLAAEGKDVYRNLVVPIPLAANHYIKGVEFHPGNARVIHHAFIDFDETRTSREQADRADPPGFDGMELPETAQMPAGQLMGWQPGKAPSFFAPGLSWLLRTNTDLVLQLHMHPSGRVETVQPTIGFYFTDQPPTNTPFRIGIKCLDIDIPAGATNYVVQESYTLPVPVTLLRVSPHAHYLAKDMKGYAVLPDGETNWLIWIRNWDFNWQGDYQYARPPRLPAGTQLVMRYTYDNSTNNPANPNNPPRRVQWGPQTSDEMGELWFQSTTENGADRAALAKDYYFYLVARSMAHDEERIRLNPDDAEAHTRLGHNLLIEGKIAEARAQFDAAIAAKSDFAPAHYEIATLYLTTRDWASAERELHTAIRFDPKNAKAYGNLGYVEACEQKVSEARADLEKAMELDPYDSAARDFLARLPAGP